MVRYFDKKAQSTLEYVVVLTAIVVAIIAAAAAFIKPAVDKSLTDAQTAIENAGTKVTQ